MARRRRRIGNIQHLVLDSLIPSKRDYATKTIGGGGRTNFDVQSTRAWDQARAQLAVQGGKSKQPHSRTALFDLIEMHAALATVSVAANSVIAAAVAAVLSICLDPLNAAMNSRFFHSMT